MDANSLSASAIAAVAGAVLSLLFNYIPGLNTAFDRLSADKQRMVMGLVILVTAVGMAIWQCSDSTSSSAISYCQNGMDWRVILQNAVFALIGNQSTDRISPKPRSNETTSSSDVIPAGNVTSSALLRDLASRKGVE
jgi:hypothetical protein